MKKCVPSFLTLTAIFLVGAAVYASSYFAADFMSASAAEKKWGVLKLNAEQFKAGDLSKRRLRLPFFNPWHLSSPNSSRLGFAPIVAVVRVSGVFKENSFGTPMEG